MKMPKEHILKNDEQIKLLEDYEENFLRFENLFSRKLLQDIQGEIQRYKIKEKICSISACVAGIIHVRFYKDDNFNGFAEFEIHYDVFNPSARYRSKFFDNDLLGWEREIFKPVRVREVI